MTEEEGKACLICVIDKALRSYENFKFSNNQKFKKCVSVGIKDLTPNVELNSLEDCEIVNFSAKLKIQTSLINDGDLGDFIEKEYQCNSRLKITNYIPADIENKTDGKFVGHITDAVINCR